MGGAWQFGFHEKSEIPFVPGTLRGVRLWQVIINRVPEPVYPSVSELMSQIVAPDELFHSGVLGPYAIQYRTDYILRGAYGYHWTPGMNIARCDATDIAIAPQVSMIDFLDLANRMASPHDPPGPNCGCGMWAYWNFEEERYWNVMAGVIEASGRAKLGERGFRCQKARILALAPHWLGFEADFEKLQQFPPPELARLTQHEMAEKVTTHLGQKYGAALFPDVNTMLEEFPTDSGGLLEGKI